MPKFRAISEPVVIDEEKPLEFIALTFLQGMDTAKFEENKANLTNAIKQGALILVLDLSREDMPTPTREQRGKGTGVNVIYGESKKLFSGIEDDNGNVLVNVVAYRPVAGEAIEEKVEDGNTPSADSSTNTPDDAEV